MGYIYLSLSGLYRAGTFPEVYSIIIAPVSTRIPSVLFAENNLIVVILLAFIIHVVGLQYSLR